MKSMILCEGSSDFALIQYYMRSVYGWNDMDEQENIMGNKVRRMRTLTKNDSWLSIAGCGGCSRIIPALDYVLERNELSADGESIESIVVLTDRDEIGSEDAIIENIKKVLEKHHIDHKGEIVNNTWSSYHYMNAQGTLCYVKLLLLVIPFEDTGAMETFLLHAIAAEDPYDGALIQKCNEFVDSVDVEKRYLTKRRYVTKAKFDVYFSIRTSAEQFTERQKVLLTVPWENYSKIQRDFEKLGDLV